MKRTFLLSIVIFLLCFISAFPQKQGKSSFSRNQIGIQFNPYINKQFFDFRIMNTVSALRYGYRITKNITTGLEFSCNFPINVASGQSFHIYNYFSYKIGLYTRYSILSERRFQIFVEASPYFSHYYREWTSSFDHSAYRVNELGYYAAPGVTLYSKNKNFSFDLYYKFSNLSFVNGNKSVFSYKVNYNF
jgi:hypothetical protein